MLDLSNPSISIKRQSELAGVNRTSAYRKETISKESEANIWLMHRIDEIHTEFPTYGYRIISGILRNDGIIVNRKRIRRLMRLMGIQAIYPGPNLSKLLHSKYIKPYLLRNLEIVRPDQVWGVDITYIRMEQGFMYMFVILDWFSRCVIDYELSTTLEKGFVITCLNRALAKSRPEIINSDQGGHFTNEEYTGLLNSLGIKISMDGKGRATDNARTERFFRTMKYDCIYINEFESPKQLRSAIAKFIEQYNYQRPSQPLNYEAPATIYYQNALKKAA
jgi:putative transposase